MILKRSELDKQRIRSLPADGYRIQLTLLYSRVLRLCLCLSNFVTDVTNSTGSLQKLPRMLKMI
jgi:hypothetical protein